MGGTVSDYRLADDSDLVASIRDGIEPALEVLYDRYHRQCYALSLRILGSEPDAEEAVQETFVRVWRSAPQYDTSRAGVPNWVLSIARNLCIDELRRRRRRAPQLPSFDDAMEMAGTERTDVEAERAVVGGQVRAALHSLPPDQRRSIELVYFHGLSSQEVGTILRVPPPTVRSRLRLGLLKLGSILKAEGLMTVD